MQQSLINLSPDLKRLRDEGYSLEIRENYLLVHDVPYVNSKSEIQRGKIILPLYIIGGIAKYSGNHVVHFMGEYPCYQDGKPIEGIRHQATDTRISDDIIENFSFSNKPQNGYTNLYEQITRYVSIISSPAKSIDNSITAKTFHVFDDKIENSIFQYVDTNESRANIANVNNKLRGQKIAIIGLGGTGSYVLDFVAKTPVAEIHLFDNDAFLQHNAFRCPGAASKDEIDKSPSKVDYLKKIYSNMHKHIFAHKMNIGKENLSYLSNMTYVFICMDSSIDKDNLIQYLIKNNKSFFDVGIGTQVVNDSLIGTIRLTSASPRKYNHLESRIPVSNEIAQDDVYTSNIQIADLNAFNAILAVIKWKKLSGFYQDLSNEFFSTYTINDNVLINEDKEVNP